MVDAPSAYKRCSSYQHFIVFSHCVPLPPPHASVSPPVIAWSAAACPFLWLFDPCMDWCGGRGVMQHTRLRLTRAEPLLHKPPVLVSAPLPPWPTGVWVWLCSMCHVQLCALMGVLACFFAFYWSERMKGRGGCDDWSTHPLVILVAFIAFPHQPRFCSPATTLTVCTVPIATRDSTASPTNAHDHNKQRCACYRPVMIV